MSVIRAFIAIRLSDEILHGLDQTLVELKKRLPKAPVRWVPPQNIHLTIKFLGDVSVASLDLLTQMLQTEASRHTPFEFNVGGLGAFPSARRPRVVWVGVDAPPALGALQRGVEAEMARLGYEPEGRDFSPHLTLGRVNRNAGPGDLRDLAGVLESYRPGALGAVSVQAVRLYRSDLHPTGSVYTELFSANLGANAQ
jgi:2'-5' RNA ligase